MASAQSLKSINVYNADGTIDLERTRKERKRFITERGLKDTESYSKGFEITDDESGLQIFKMKTKK